MSALHMLLLKHRQINLIASNTLRIFDAPEPECRLELVGGGSHAVLGTTAAGIPHQLWCLERLEKALINISAIRTVTLFICVAFSQVKSEVHLQNYSNLVRLHELHGTLLHMLHSLEIRPSLLPVQPPFKDRLHFTGGQGQGCDALKKRARPAFIASLHLLQQKTTRLKFYFATSLLPLGLWERGIMGAKQTSQLFYQQCRVNPFVLHPCSNLL